MAKPISMRHLYEIYTLLQPPLLESVYDALIVAAANQIEVFVSLFS